MEKKMGASTIFGLYRGHYGHPFLHSLRTASKTPVGPCAGRMLGTRRHLSYSLNCLNKGILGV